MSKFQDMKDEELDKLAAEMFPEYHLAENVDGALCLWDDDDCIVHRWHPTHPDSNQCERWLFPKLKAKGCRIDTFDSNTFTFQIIIHLNMQELNSNTICKMSDTLDPDQINRTKVIACLEAFSKLNQTTEGGEDCE